MTETASRLSRIRIILVAVGAFLLYGLVAGIRANSSILSEALATHTGLLYGEVTTAFSVMNLVFAFSVVVFGILSLKIRIIHIIFIGLISSFIAFMGASIFTSQIGLIIFLGIFLGIGASALCFSIVFAAAEPFIAKKYLSIFSGILIAAQGICGTLLAPAMGGTIETFGLTACLKVIAIVVLCLIPLVILFIRKKNTETAEDVQKTNQQLRVGTTLKKMITHPFFYFIAFCSFVCGISDGGMMNHAFQYYFNLSLSDTFSTTIVSVYSFSIIFGGIIGGLFCMKCKNYRLCLGFIATAWFIVSFVIGTLVLFLGDVPELCVVLLLASAFVSGVLINSAMPILTMMVTKRVSAAALATALVVIEFSTMLGYSFDAFIGGLCFDTFGVFFPVDYFAYALTIVMAGICLVLGIRAKRNKTREDIII